MTARRGRVGLGQLGDQRRPGKLGGAEAGAGTRVVVLAQPFALDRADHPAGQPRRRLLVAEAAQAEPDQPGGVDPGRTAPVAPQRPAVATGLVARLGCGDRWWRDRGEELTFVEQVLLDQAAADRLRQI